LEQGRKSRFPGKREVKKREGRKDQEEKRNGKVAVKQEQLDREEKGE